EQRALAGAARPHDADELAAPDLEVDVPQHPDLRAGERIRALDVGEANQRVHRSLRSHSCLSATAGSTASARRTGTRTATTTAAIRTPSAPRTAVAPAVSIVCSECVRRRASPMPAPTPIARPAPSSTALCPNTSPSTLPAGAPSVR